MCSVVVSSPRHLTRRRRLCGRFRDSRSTALRPDSEMGVISILNHLFVLLALAAMRLSRSRVQQLYASYNQEAYF